MKSSFHIPFLGACLVWLCVSLCQAQEVSPELRRNWDILHSDVGGDDVAYHQARKELATRPEFKAELLALLQREFFEALKLNQKGNARALGPLSLRSDLTASELKPITDELKKRVEATNGFTFNNTAIHLLEHYPSPEHEDLVIKFLNRDADQDYTLTVAFQTLAAIGGSKSLEAMKQVAARLKAKNPKSWFLEELGTRVMALETRLKQEVTTGRPQTAPAVSQPKKPSATGAPITATSESPAARTADWRVWLSLLGGLILVLALSCRVFRKKH